MPRWANKMLGKYFLFKQVIARIDEALEVEEGGRGCSGGRQLFPEAAKYAGRDGVFPSVILAVSCGRRKSAGKYFRGPAGSEEGDVETGAQRFVRAANETISSLRLEMARGVTAE